MDDTACADELAKGIDGKRLTYRRPSPKEHSVLGLSTFLRRKHKQPKSSNVGKPVEAGFQLYVDDVRAVCINTHP